jgi:hypothetical protein
MKCSLTGLDTGSQTWRSVERPRAAFETVRLPVTDAGCVSFHAAESDQRIAR